MKSLLSIASGSTFIVVASLLLQLIALLVMVAYKLLAKDYPFLDDIGGVFRYLVGIPSFLLVMFIGGYISAMFAKNKILLHTLIVGSITTSATMFLALDYMEITVTGVVVIVLMLVATVAGGMLWQKRNRVIEN